MTQALAHNPADTAELAQLRSEVHRLRSVIDACDVRHLDDVAALDEAARRYADLYQQTQRHIHALEQRGAKVWPVHVRCDSCSSVVAFDPEPSEPDLAAALIALRWSLEHGHRCPKCTRGR